MGYPEGTDCQGCSAPDAVLECEQLRADLERVRGEREELKGQCVRWEAMYEGMMAERDWLTVDLGWMTKDRDSAKLWGRHLEAHNGIMYDECVKWLNWARFRPGHDLDVLCEATQKALNPDTAAEASRVRGLEAQNTDYELAIDAALDELGIPTTDYPAPVAIAWGILRAVRGGADATA